MATAALSPAQTLTTLHSFNGNDGAIPYAGLIQATDGNFYGTTENGGVNNGTVFKITPTGTFTTAHFFCTWSNCLDGSNPFAGLVQGTDGNLYGTTVDYGGYGYGNVFQLSLSDTMTALYSFCAEANCPDQGYPFAALVQGTDGNFYGTASGEWALEGFYIGNGTVFKINPQGTLTTLHSFVPLIDGEDPTAGLVEGTDGNFYGTASGGGSGRGIGGTVFKITPAGTLTTLYMFCAQTNCADGSNPYAGLIQASDGNFYGTTVVGGAYSSTSNQGYGTVFRITPAGTLTTLHSFSGPDGAYPQGALVQGTDGNFYGTTSAGGAYGGSSTNHGDGTVFRITPAGTFRTLYNFCVQANCADGDNPVAALMQATDGNFYGTTSGLDEPYTTNGTVFKLSVGLEPFVKTNPTSGKVGAKVIILGNNLKGTTSVTFNGTPAPLLKVTASAIETSVPTGATTGTVTVTTPNGILNSNVAFRILP